ncbi:MAG: thioredoxin family protein [Alphaproteobacteria bacterium]|jgi:hypothetical protein|nr:thioredoxin family protein [Alphaproteobacteria bacterium]
MAKTRKIEIFSAGCQICEDIVADIRAAACPSCDVVVQDMKDPAVAYRAKSLGVESVPAVAIDGALVDCCAGRGPDMARLKAAGLGQPLG